LVFARRCGVENEATYNRATAAKTLVVAGR
jgi:hypothetical protein